MVELEIFITMNNKIIISDMYRCKNKQSFFAIHQITSKIHSYKPNCKIEYHILWDNNTEGETDNINWEEKINSLISNNVTFHSYDRKFFDDYVLNDYNIKPEFITNFKKFPSIYLLLMAHYLRNIKKEDCYLIYDDDILINYDFHDIIDYIINKQSVLIVEIANSNCDKVLFNKIRELYSDDFTNIYKQRNPYLFGFNAGFQCIDLSIYDEFIDIDNFQLLLNLFDFSGIYDSEGNEIWGPNRFLLDTQQQSFFGIMNIVKSKVDPIILDPYKYFVVPNWGTSPIHGNINIENEFQGWDVALKSKITHFIGHTMGKGKPKIFLNLVDEYLKENNLL